MPGCLTDTTFESEGGKPRELSKLGRTSSQRKAMLRDLTTDLFINERIVTTGSSQVKEVRSTAEK